MRWPLGLPGRRADGFNFRWSRRESGQLVGDAGLCAVDDEVGVVKTGYTIAPAFQGRG